MALSLIHILLSLADDEAAMLGVSVRTARIIILILTTLMVAGIVSVTGAISFVGLVAPHIARMILKENGFSAGILSGITAVSYTHLTVQKSSQYLQQQFCGIPPGFERKENPFSR